MLTKIPDREMKRRAVFEFVMGCICGFWILVYVAGIVAYIVRGIHKW